MDAERNSLSSSVRWFSLLDGSADSGLARPDAGHPPLPGREPHQPRSRRETSNGAGHRARFAGTRGGAITRGRTTRRLTVTAAPLSFQLGPKESTMLRASIVFAIFFCLARPGAGRDPLCDHRRVGQRCLYAGGALQDLQRGYAVAAAGDTIQVAAGTYPAQTVPGGTKAVTFKGGTGVIVRSMVIERAERRPSTGSTSTRTTRRCWACSSAARTRPSRTRRSARSSTRRACSRRRRASAARSTT